MKEFEKQIEMHIKAKYPIILVESYEENRVITAAKNATKCDQLKEMGVISWSVTRGLERISREGETMYTVQKDINDPIQLLNEIEKYIRPAIFVVKDIHPFLLDPSGAATLTRKIRDIYAVLKCSDIDKVIIFVSPSMTIPCDLQKCIVVIDLPLPTKDELGEVLDAALTGIKKQGMTVDYIAGLVEKFNEQLKDRDAILTAGLGLTLEEFENVVAKCFAAHCIDVKTINEEKKQIIRKSGILEYFEANETMDSVGGLDVLKEWIKRAKKRFGKKAEEFGLEPPKGILLIGPPGTGKTLSAKVIAHELRLPMVVLDMGELASKYYGETSNRVKQALKLATAISPCLLLFDECEKMFSTGGGLTGEGHEETMRAIGTLLTDFEENTAPIVRVGTCNNPFNLKPEFMQRFDTIWFVDLPSTPERSEILSIQIKRVKRDPAKFDVSTLAIALDGFVGREIRNLIKEAMVVAFDLNGDLTTDIIASEAGKITPTSKQKEEDIKKMREWASKNARNASNPESAVMGATSGARRVMV